MKGLFIVFHGFSAHSGISKKIFAQCEALRLNGVDIALCHLEIGADGTQRRMAGDTVIRTFGSGLRAKLLKRVSYADITDYIRREGVPVPLHPPRPERQSAARGVAAPRAPARGAHRARNPHLPLRRGVPRGRQEGETPAADRPDVPPRDGPAGRPHRHLFRRRGDFRAENRPYLQRHRLRHDTPQNRGARPYTRGAAAGAGQHPPVARLRPRDRGAERLLRRAARPDGETADRGRRPCPT